MINSIEIKTPLGKMLACATEMGVCLLEYCDKKELESVVISLSKKLSAEIHPGTNHHLTALCLQLDAYFKGQLKNFTLPLVLSGTGFQQLVWKELQNIPYGTTRTYRQQAVALKNPEAIRAVANANGRNKINIVIPCHRVIGTDGRMTGYGGGLWRKQWLLEMESNNTQFKLPFY
jgi:AraC family transcriptional regulator, regulatory protein of adaptative response / methylated-DNA-[protein]-cysteine methyltransferase